MENSIAKSNSSYSEQLINLATPLIQTEDRDSLRPVQGAARSLRVRYCRTHKCITSKAALIILLWSFAVSLVYSIVLNPDIYMQVFSHIARTDSIWCCSYCPVLLSFGWIPGRYQVWSFHGQWKMNLLYVDSTEAIGDKNNTTNPEISGLHVFFPSFS